MTTSAPRSTTAATTTESTSLRELAERYRAVRTQTERLQQPLSAEDCTTQSMPDASPTKWHLGHTSWFFETLVVKAVTPGYRDFRDAFQVIFNSYYNSLGAQHPRPQRGLLSRPSLEDVLAYRAHVDSEMMRVFDGGDTLDAEVMDTIEIGLHHEQQHQELILTDIKHLLWSNPLRPVYHAAPHAASATPPALTWIAHPGGVVSIGFEGDEFAYDNERPRHKVFLEPFALASRPVTNGEYLDFMRDGGYTEAGLWLSDGWAAVQTEGWTAPLYWERVDDAWHEFTLGGRRPVDANAPVCHLSYYEADAFARWAGDRLPREAEWELIADAHPSEGTFVEQGRYHPSPADPDESGPTQQILGEVWEWTRSGYEPYPGYEPPAGPLGEYNSKFMCSQLVLRGGSCATPRSHIRTTYRNFFPPNARWQFSGIRLARNA